MVLVLHILGQGGILETVVPLSAKYNIAWLLEIAAYCAVNCYVLITGYVSVKSTFRYSRIFILWLQVLFYTLLITIGFTIFKPGTIGTAAFINALLPVIKNQYWYFTSYFGLFFLIPFLNILVRTLDKRSFKLLVITLFTLFSIIPTITSIDIFRIYGGYSLIWLVVLYFIGAYIKLYGLGKERKRAFYIIWYFASIGCVWLSKLILTYWGYNGNVLIDYTSPFIVSSAVSLLVLFSGMNITKRIPRILIRFFAPAAFSVYLIHAHPLMWNRVMHLRFAGLVSFGTLAFAASVLAVAAVVFIACSLVDHLRIALFKILRVSSLAEKLEAKIQKTLLEPFADIHIHHK